MGKTYNVTVSMSGPPVTDGVFNVKAYGAVGDGVADDTGAIQAAVNAAKASSGTVFMPYGSYRTTGTITIGCNFNGIGAEIKPDLFTGPAVLIADSSDDDPGYLRSVDISLPAITGKPGNPTSSWATDNQGIKVVHLDRSRVVVSKVSSFRTGVLVTAHEKGSQSCDYFLSYIENCKFSLKIETLSGRNGWVNENNFFGGQMNVSSALGSRGASGIRLISLIAGNRTPDNNVFYKPHVEGTIDEYAIFCQGDWNTFISPRIEGGDAVSGKKIAFDGSGATKNMVFSGLQIDEAIGSNAAFSVEESNSAVGNSFITANGMVLPVGDTATTGIRLKHNTDNTKRIMGFYENAINIWSAAQQWQVGIGASGVDGKRDTDTEARVRLDPTGGGVVFGDGSSSLALMPWVRSGSGSPEGVVSAPMGSMYINRLGGAGTSLYVKESGTGNTGWVAK